MSNEDKPTVVQKSTPWLKDLKNQHKVFKFSNNVPKKPETKVEPLYQDEKDLICQLIRKILYSEGDFVRQSNDGVKNLKKKLSSIIELFEDQKKRKKSENKRQKKFGQKESDASSVESFDYGQKKGIIVDFSMFYYVFDNLL